MANNVILFIFRVLRIWIGSGSIGWDQVRLQRSTKRNIFLKLCFDGRLLPELEKPSWDFRAHEIIAITKYFVPAVNVQM
jgi:hypothetical protein